MSMTSDTIRTLEALGPDPRIRTGMDRAEEAGSDHV
jgi:hypothetical protein